MYKSIGHSEVNNMKSRIVSMFNLKKYLNINTINIQSFYQYKFNLKEACAFYLMFHDMTCNLHFSLEESSKLDDIILKYLRMNNITSNEELQTIEEFQYKEDADDDDIYIDYMISLSEILEQFSYINQYISYANGFCYAVTDIEEPALDMERENLNNCLSDKLDFSKPIEDLPDIVFSTYECDPEVIILEDTHLTDNLIRHIDNTLHWSIIYDSYCCYNGIYQSSVKNKVVITYDYTASKFDVKQLIAVMLSCLVLSEENSEE